jgi:hypothetical protein
MAVSTLHDPPIRASHAASPLLHDSRPTNVPDPCLVHPACAHSRFVPDLVSSKLLGFESKHVVRRPIEAAKRLTEEEQLAKLHRVVKVANDVGSHTSEFSAAARNRAARSN